MKRQPNPNDVLHLVLPALKLAQHKQQEHSSSEKNHYNHYQYVTGSRVSINVVYTHKCDLLPVNIHNYIYDKSLIFFKKPNVCSNATNSFY